MLLPLSKTGARSSASKGVPISVTTCRSALLNTTATDRTECWEERRVNAHPSLCQAYTNIQLTGLEAAIHPTYTGSASMPVCLRHLCRGGYYIEALLLCLFLDHPLGLQIFGATLTQNSSFRRRGIVSQVGQHSRKSLQSLYSSRSGSSHVCQLFSKF